MSASQKTCVVTGAHGWLGRCVTAALKKNGWTVRSAVRRPTPEEVTSGAAVAFQLGAPVPPELFRGADALVHCAYDFHPTVRGEVFAVNVEGSQRLLAAARAAGVRHLVVISTMSAFDGCVSVYGQAKLAIEKDALQAGAAVLRPGLIYGEGAGGMFGRLVAQVRAARILPLFGGGGQQLYLIHEQDLAGLILRCCDGTLAPPAPPLIAAHEQPWTFRQILEAIAGRLGRRLTFVPMPWRPLWLALRVVEALGMRLSFRSDSLLSLMNQDPRPDFPANAPLGLQPRPFHVAEVLRITPGE